MNPENQQHQSSPIFTAALAFAANGCSVVPAAVNGTKAPIGSWKKYQTERANGMQIQQWFKDPSQTGLGIITGRVSGNLEMLEFEGRAVDMGLLTEATDLATNSGLLEIWQKVTGGYAEFTPSGGLHFYYRVSDHEIPGNAKIARQPGEDGGVLIETRGEGGFSIVAPSSGMVHLSGKAWVAIAGSPGSIPTITWDEREAVHNVLKALDRMPAPETVLEVIAHRADAGGGVSPGDDYSNRTTWDEILIPRGWSKVFTAGSTTYWRRPGKSVGISATTGRNDGDNLFVFSTSTEFEAEKPYSKFSAFTHLEHNGDYKAAARQLRANGYGVPSIVQNTESHRVESLDPRGDGYVENNSSTPPKFLTNDEILLNEEIAKGRARRRAKELLDNEDATKRYDPFIYVETLAEELELPVEEVDWTIEGLIPTGANVTLTAQYKAGKTTMINNLAKALVDGTRFLNYFKPANHPGRVVIFNYEVSENQYRRWMKDVAIEHTESVTLFHLRGKSVPLRSDYVREQIIDILGQMNVHTWILDPFARAFTGSGDENSNSDVGVFLDMLDIIKERAGIKNLILPVHTGRAQEFGVDRARGATRIDDWADVRWLLKKTDDGRFFSADGRDVLLEEQLVKFDESTRGLTLGGGDARSVKKDNATDRWIEAVTANPGKNTSEISAIIGKDSDNNTYRAARKQALRENKVKTVRVGPSELWYPIDYLVPFNLEIETA